MSQRRKSPYGKYGVYALPSYDFHDEGLAHSDQYSRKADVRPKKVSKKTISRSPALVISVALCVLMLFAALSLQSQLVSLSYETVEVRREIDQLLDEQTKLKIRHGMSFSLADTEQYAIDVLGMQKPSPEQIYYIDVDCDGYTESADTVKRGDNSILSMLREYFPG